MRQRKTLTYSTLAMVLCGICLAVSGLFSCDSYDCTLNNTVECKLGFYNDSSGAAVAIKDTLSILDATTDSVILNRVTAASSVSIPLSYYKDKDTLKLLVKDSLEHVDWIVIEKTNREYFESLDCPVNVFHTITGVSTFHRSFIDTVTINYPQVEYNNGENIKIYLHTTK